MSGALKIAAERNRQITEEGYTVEHDEGHVFQLIEAATAYAQHAGALDEHGVDLTPDEVGWPWHHSFWKPSGTIRDLVKAGALIAAAIDSIEAEERNNELRADIEKQGL